MAKRRRNKRTLDRKKEENIDDDDDDEEKIRRTPSRERLKEKQQKKEDLIILGVFIIIILIIIGGYLTYTTYFQEEKEEATKYYVHSVQLQVISDSTRNFADSSSHNADINRPTGFLLLVTNTGEADDTFQLTSSGPTDGWSVSFDNSKINVKKNGAIAVIASITSTNEATGTFTITATSTLEETASDSITLTVNAFELDTPTAHIDDKVEVYYVLVNRGADADFNPDVWSYDEDGPLTTINNYENVIPGFADMVDGMKVGETQVGRIPSSKAYGDAKDDNKPDGDLIFEIELIRIDT